MSEVIPFITTQERIRNLCAECPRHSGSLLLPIHPYRSVQYVVPGGHPFFNLASSLVRCPPPPASRSRLAAGHVANP